MVELCNVMHRQLLTQDSCSTQAAVLAVVSQAVTAAGEQLARKRKAKLKELYPANQSIPEMPAEVTGMGEGGDDGDISHGSSVTFAVMEVCMCLLVRYFPDISPRAAQSSSVIAMQVNNCQAKIKCRFTYFIVFGLILFYFTL